MTKNKLVSLFLLFSVPAFGVEITYINSACAARVEGSLLEDKIREHVVGFGTVLMARPSDLLSALVRASAADEQIEVYKALIEKGRRTPTENPLLARVVAELDQSVTRNDLLFGILSAGAKFKETSQQARFVAPQNHPFVRSIRWPGVSLKSDGKFLKEYIAELRGGTRPYDRQPVSLAFIDPFRDRGFSPDGKHVSAAADLFYVLAQYADHHLLHRYFDAEMFLRHRELSSPSQLFENYGRRVVGPDVKSWLDHNAARLAAHHPVPREYEVVIEQLLTDAWVFSQELPTAWSLSNAYQMQYLGTHQSYPRLKGGIKIEAFEVAGQMAAAHAEASFVLDDFGISRAETVDIESLLSPSRRTGFFKLGPLITQQMEETVAAARNVAP